MFGQGDALIYTFMKDESLRGNSESLGVLKKMRLIGSLVKSSILTCII